MTGPSLPPLPPAIEAELASLRPDPRFQELLADLRRRESERAKPAA